MSSHTSVPDATVLSKISAYFKTRSNEDNYILRHQKNGLTKCIDNMFHAATHGLNTLMYNIKNFESDCEMWSERYHKLFIDAGYNVSLFKDGVMVIEW